jgi:hypothetical protein
VIVHGYTVEEMMTTGSTVVYAVTLEPGDPRVVITKRLHDPIAANAGSAAVYRQNLLDYRSELDRRYGPLPA